VTTENRSNVRGIFGAQEAAIQRREIAIFDEAVIYKRGAYWHFRMWLNNERKYARQSLRTRSKTTAIEKEKEAGCG